MEIYTVSEMCLHKDLYKVSMTKEVIGGYVIVLVWDTGQGTHGDRQYLKRARMRGLFKEDEFSRVRYEFNMVVWDTGQQCLERAMMGGLFKEDKAHGLRQMHRSYI